MYTKNCQECNNEFTTNDLKKFAAVVVLLCTTTGCEDRTEL